MNFHNNINNINTIYNQKKAGDVLFILFYIIPRQPGNKRRHESESSPQLRKRTRPSPNGSSDMDVESGMMACKKKKKITSYLCF